MRLASFNVENLFERVKPMNDTDWKAGREILTVWAELNGLFAKPAYSAADQKNILDRLDKLGLARSDELKIAILRQNRGKLRATRGGKLVIVATGRGDWVGWVELKTEPVNAEAIANTGRVMGDGQRGHTCRHRGGKSPGSCCAFPSCSCPR